MLQGIDLNMYYFIYRITISYQCACCLLTSQYLFIFAATDEVFTTCKETPSSQPFKATLRFPGTPSPTSLEESSFLLKEAEPTTPQWSSQNALSLRPAHSLDNINRINSTPAMATEDKVNGVQSKDDSGVFDTTVASSLDLEDRMLMSPGSRSSTSSRRSSISDFSFSGMRDLQQGRCAPPLQSTRRMSLLNTLEREKRASSSGSKLKGLQIPSRKSSTETSTTEMPVIGKDVPTTTLPRTEHRRTSYTPLFPVVRLTGSSKQNGTVDKLNKEDFKAALSRRPPSVDGLSGLSSTSEPLKSPSISPPTDFKKDVMAESQEGTKPEVEDTKSKMETIVNKEPQPMGVVVDEEPSEVPNGRLDSPCIQHTVPSLSSVSFKPSSSSSASTDLSESRSPSETAEKVTDKENKHDKSFSNQITLKDVEKSGSGSTKLEVRAKPKVTPLDVETGTDSVFSVAASPTAKSPHKTPPPLLPKPQKSVTSPTSRKALDTFVSSSPLQSPPVSTVPQVTTVIASFSPTGVQDDSFSLKDANTAKNTADKSPPLPTAQPPSSRISYRENAEEIWSVIENTKPVRLPVKTAPSTISTISEEPITVVQKETDPDTRTLENNDSMFDSSEELESTMKSTQRTPERSPGLSLNKDVISISREDLSEGRESILSSPDTNLPLSPTPSDADSGIYYGRADHQRSDSGQSGKSLTIFSYHRRSNSGESGESLIILSYHQKSTLASHVNHLCSSDDLTCLDPSLY